MTNEQWFALMRGRLEVAPNVPLVEVPDCPPADLADKAYLVDGTLHRLLRDDYKNPLPGWTTDDLGPNDGYEIL